MHMKQQGTSDLKEKSVPSLINPILLGSSLMEDTMLGEVREKNMKHIFFTIIRMENLELSVKLSFN